ncbi:MAG TPA: hypothetical protein VMV94_14775 [Phycisphaerae bacterium]|nr:hypothetical protein [Phycisphaerae bacterium]
MKRRIKKWYIAGSFVAVVLVALAQIVGNDWWAIHYAKYLAGADNAYVGQAGQVCFAPASKSPVSPTQSSGTTPAGPLAHR